MRSALEAANFHLVKPCNMRCTFCYATFEDAHVARMLTLAQVRTVIDRLAEGGVQKVNFAGGEPLLFKGLRVAIAHAKRLGMATSIITNGSLLTPAWMASVQGSLDWIGLSVDSLDAETNRRIGRVSRLQPHYDTLVKAIRGMGFRLKVNTVVNLYNQDESLQDFIDEAQPKRWKIFEALRVEGQNDAQYEAIRPTPEGFAGFVARHRHPAMVVEDNHAMTGSYLMVDPLGRLFDNTKGHHTYSRSLLDHPLGDCLEDVTVYRDRFLARGGVYDWNRLLSVVKDQK